MISILIGLITIVATINPKSISITTSSESKEIEVDMVIQGMVNHGTVQYIKSVVKDLDSKELRIFINSRGGYLDSGLEIINFMKAMKNEKFVIKCIALRAESAAASIFAECDTRITYNNSIWAQHKGGLIYSGKCDWLCEKLDIARLETGARNLNKTPYGWRSNLPKLNDPIFRLYGSKIYSYGVSNKHYHKNIEIDINKEDN